MERSTNILGGHMSELIDPPVAETNDQDEEAAAPVSLGVASEETRGSFVGVVADGFLGYQLY
jgi:hypothetical protein